MKARAACRESPAIKITSSGWAPTTTTVRYAYTFNTKDECIYYAANILSSSYLSRWGRNYRGDNLRAIGIRYATDPYWAEKVSRNMSRVARAAIPEGR